MVAKSGHRLISNNSINYLRKKLLPFALIVTPNIPEAEKKFLIKSHFQLRT